MSGGIYGPYARLVRWCLRLAWRRWQTGQEAPPPTPSVFVARHQNLSGPILSAVLLEREVRIWVLSVFFTFRDCFKQYYGYTFTKRFGWPKLLAVCAALPCALLVPPLLRSLDAIPVYRGSARIAETFRISVRALSQGESVLICPDQDYASEGGDTGALYLGFLHLARHAAKAGCAPAAFVPLCPARSTRRFVSGPPLYFPGKVPFKAEQARMAQNLAEELDRMHREYGGTGR